MLEICPSGLMSGIWKRSTYVPPRQISTLRAPWKGHVDPVGGSWPTRQLLLQPEAIGAWAAGNGGARGLRCKRSRKAGSASI